MVKAIVIDDNNEARKTLIQLIQLIDLEVAIVGEAQGVQEGIALIKLANPELVFLDIQMLDGTGFDLLDHIPNPSFHIIFTTAYSEFALKAFEYLAIDYLLKPISPKALVRAINKITTVVNFHTAREQLALLQQNLSDKKEQRIALSTQDGLICLDLDDIIRLSSDGGYTTFFVLNGDKITISKNIKTFDHLLPPDQFARPHQSHMVNLKYINKILKEDGGYIEMSDTSHVPISRRNKEAFLKDVIARNFL